ncbi:Outer membrane protein beta-barrel domain-containing protein [Spirosomataceae bacterium TFI 002]|nr:Outer membrane protein beta-barrel domain-containing protein [Spirosomataceae bacterium TFI 002]
MKKIIIAILAFTSFSTAVVGQDAFKIGLRGGVNLSQVKGDGNGSSEDFWEENASRVTGFTGGVFMRVGNKVFIQPELILSQKGGTTTGILGAKKEFKKTYIDVPVLVGVTLGDVVRFNAGPMASFLINKEDSFFDNLGITKEEEGFRKAILGYQAGVGFDISKIAVDFRYEGNINDVFNIDYNNNQTEAQFAGKGNLFFVTVGYTF